MPSSVTVRLRKEHTPQPIVKKESDLDSIGDVSNCNGPMIADGRVEFESADHEFEDEYVENKEPNDRVFANNTLTNDIQKEHEQSSGLHEAQMVLQSRKCTKRSMKSLDSSPYAKRSKTQDISCALGICSWEDKSPANSGRLG